MRRLMRILGCALAGGLLLLAGCGEPETRGAGSPGAEGSGAVVVHRVPWSDAELRIVGTPQRLLPGSSAAVDLLGLLMARERAVALPADALRFATPAAPESWRQLPTFAQFSAESVLAFTPDLVLASPFSNAESRAAIARQGVPVLVLPPLESLEEVVRVLSFLGEVLDAEERAREAALALGAGELVLVARSTARGSRPRVLSYSNYGGVGRSAGAGTSFDEVLRIAGCENAASSAGIEGHGEMPFERLLKIDPDFIVVARRGLDGRASRGILEGSERLSALKARAPGRIIEIEGRLLAANSHVILEAAKELMDRLDAFEKEAAGGR